MDLLYKKIRQKKKVYLLFSISCILFSSFLQAYTIISFIQPASLLSSGFTGVALLFYFVSDGHIPIYIGILLLNTPVALICFKKINPRFVILSCLQFLTTSFFLTCFSFSPLFEDLLLNVIFGGVLYGTSVLIALKVGASTGGTDFIALYLSNKLNRSLWSYVFLFNTIIIFIFGFLQGWRYAAYSILFQFISTKTIDSFHTRYKQVTLQIITSTPKEIMNTYFNKYKHGMSCLDGLGGYSQKSISILFTVVSSYELREIIDLIKKTDPKVVINVFKTEKFIGHFHQDPLD